MRHILNEQKNNTIRQHKDGDKKGKTNMSEKGTKTSKTKSGTVLGDTMPLNPKVKPTTQAPSTPPPKKK